jgi:3-phenylpropionate/trans-cinnamate dioxygenase ferredoxin reductase subunit
VSGTLVVGAGQAGVALAVALRGTGYTAPVTVVGGEPHPPYQRPPLSKGFLDGTSAEASLALRTPAFYAERDITLHTGEHVVAADARAGTAVTDRGTRLRFDRLALTVGARARRLAAPGAELDGVLHLRDLADARQLRDRLRTARDVIVIGGGFIGLEAAAVARGRGLTVTVVEAADRLLARSVTPATSTFYRDAHLARGTDVRLGAAVAAVHGSAGRVAAVELSDGTRLRADLVLVGIGAQPRIELAEALGLRCADGIVVDECARTSDPDVVAAGDCTSCPDPTGGPGRVRQESVPHALAHAAVAAATIVGGPRPYTALPWFWSDQYDLKLQIGGLGRGADAHLVRGDPAAGGFSVLAVRDGWVRAVEAVNRPADFIAVRTALTRGIALPAGRAADPAVPLRELLTVSPSSV